MKVFVGLLCCVISVFAQANLVIEVTESVDEPTKIAIVPFQHSGQKLDQDLTAIVSADLTRSGLFEVLPREDMYSFPSAEGEVFYRDWRALGVEYLLIGRSVGGADSVAVTIELYDVYRQKVLARTQVSDRRGAQRAIAHAISDRIYEKLTGIPGAFATRMMYVSVKHLADGGQSYRLLIADADGARPREALKSSEPVLSPSWSPDGKQIAYVSFETSRPAIYRQTVATGAREKLTNYPGLNSAPSWSPDGKQLAMVLSKDGNPEIYILNLVSRQLRRITEHSAIDTEPSWMPDGRSLVFTSDRGGQPQIYRVELSNLLVKRLTYQGSYNAKASVLADGKGMVMIHRDESGYHIAWQELSSGRLLILTSSSLDESPSVAPNGSMLLYATKFRGRGVLAAVSLDGGVKFRLPSPTSDVREPAWAPN